MELLLSGSSLPATGVSGKRLAAAIAGVFALTVSAPALAIFNDNYEIWAAENVTRDTNVFRLSKNVDPSTIGASQRGDTIYTTHLGFTAGVPVAQQRFEAAYTWYHSRYQTFSDLDFTGHTARAAWLYNLQNRVTGVLSYTESEGLSSFSNIQSRDKDVVKLRAALGTAEWMMTPRWRASGRLLGVQSEHSSALRRIQDIETLSTEGGLSYVTPQDNLVGGTIRYEHGHSPNAATFLGSTVGVPFNNDYDQWSAGATTTYNLTPRSRFEGRVELVRRRYQEFTDRNYSGPIARAVYRWTPTPKVTVDVVALRDIGPPEDVQTSLVIITGGYVRPKWFITEKITLQGTAEYNISDYRGDPLTGGNFRHRQRLIGASLQWKPWDRVWLQVGANREVRTSTLLFGDYETTVAFIEGRVGF